MSRKTADAVEILRRRDLKNSRFREIYEEERANFQAALAIRRAREAAGLTQGQLARRVGTTQSVISRLEDADYKGHTLKMLERIAATLKRRVIISLKPGLRNAA